MVIICLSALATADEENNHNDNKCCTNETNE